MATMTRATTAAATNNIVSFDVSELVQLLQVHLPQLRLEAIVYASISNIYIQSYASLWWEIGHAKRKEKKRDMCSSLWVEERKGEIRL